MLNLILAGAFLFGADGSVSDKPADLASEWARIQRLRKVLALELGMPQLLSEEVELNDQIADNLVRSRLRKPTPGVVMVDPIK